MEILLLKHSNFQEACDVAVSQTVGKESDILKFFQESQNKNLNNIFIAVEKNKIVGVIGWYKDDGSWAGKSLGELFPYGENIFWTSFFTVAEEYRGKGLGTKLMNYLKSKLIRLDAKELWTYTTRAKGFYEKNGFIFIKRAIIENELHDFLKYTFN